MDVTPKDAYARRQQDKAFHVKQGGGPSTEVSPDSGVGLLAFDSFALGCEPHKPSSHRVWVGARASTA
jgi:hypothetical protein